MDISNLIKLTELSKQYPFLKNELVKYSDKFAAFNSPLTKAVVNRVNLEQVSQISGLDVNIPITKTKEIIAAHQA